MRWAKHLRLIPALLFFGVEGQVLALPKGNQVEIQHDNSLPDKGIWKYQLC